MKMGILVIFLALVLFLNFGCFTVMEADEKMTRLSDHLRIKVGDKIYGKSSEVTEENRGSALSSAQ